MIDITHMETGTQEVTLTSKPNRAFAVTIPTLDPDLTIIRAGQTASKVRYEELMSIWETYRKSEFTFADVTVRRAPQYDELAAATPIKGYYDHRQLGWGDKSTKYGCLAEQPDPHRIYEARKRLLVGLTPAEYERECARIAREVGV